MSAGVEGSRGHRAGGLGGTHTCRVRDSTAGPSLSPVGDNRQMCPSKPRMSPAMALELDCLGKGAHLGLLHGTIALHYAAILINEKLGTERTC